MNKIYNTEKGISLIKETYKPGLSLPILMTLIGVVIYWGIWIEASDANYNRVVLLATVAAPLMMIIGGIWTAFYFRMLQYKKEIQDFKKNPDIYEW